MYEKGMSFLCKELRNALLKALQQRYNLAIKEWVRCVSSPASDGRRGIVFARLMEAT